MRVPIYEAVAHYKKNNELPYTEYFGLGFFSQLSLAEKALTESKNMPRTNFVPHSGTAKLATWSPCNCF